MLFTFVKKYVSVISFAISLLYPFTIANAQDDPSETNPGSENIENVRNAEISRLLYILPYETSRITVVCQVNSKGKLVFLEGEYDRDFIVQEYLRTDKPIPQITDDSKWPKIHGIGIRVTIQVNSLGGKLDPSILSSFFRLGAAAEAQKVAGTISLETFGLGGRPLTSAMPVPTDINSKSIEEALSAIKKIKGKMTAPDVIFITALPNNVPRRAVNVASFLNMTSPFNNAPLTAEELPEIGFPNLQCNQPGN